MRRITRRLAFVVVVVTALVVALAIPSSSAATVSAPIAGGFAGPLQFAVGSDGTLYVAQDFAGVLTSVDKHGNRKDLASSHDGEIAGVDALGKGTVSYTTAGYDENGTVVSSSLSRVQPNGKSRILADTFTYEAQVDPDQVNHYGFSDLTPECAATVPAEIGGGNGYDGVFDTHPYSVAISGGTRYVADAAGNDILRVDPNGNISTVVVMPPQPLLVTQEVADAFGLDSCVVNHEYAFEPVPTDVEVGPNGLLYVSTLPGGPEDPSLGARGSVYTVNPNTGQVTQIATGFAGATNVAVAPNGTVYVAELFANQISKIVNGTTSPVVSLNEPAAVEWANGKLYASIDVFDSTNGGSIVSITL